MANKSIALRPVAIVGGVRIPFCRAGTQYAELSTLELLTEALKALVDRYSLHGQILGDVALGTTFYHPAVWNLAREATLKSGLAPETPAMGVQRACATSLDAAIAVANKIATGRMESGVAGGAESISNVSIFYQQELARRLMRTMQGKSLRERVSAWKGLHWKELKPATPPAFEPSTGQTMGAHCEQMAKEWKITRGEQDALALKSHQNGIAAYERGFYEDLLRPFQGVTRDGNLRAETSLEKLAKLKPSFDKSSAGTLTAGNSSPLTDGAACVLLASEDWAKERGLPVLAYLTDYESAGVDIRKEGLLMAPAYAAPRLLDRAGLTLQSFDFYEIHEAFAAQVLCTLKAWESETFCRDRLKRDVLGTIDREKLNVAGGSVALGHPFGATGARLIATMAKLLAEKGSGKGLLSICTGGGMGTVAIVER